jgi:hypothetical protein
MVKCDFASDANNGGGDGNDDAKVDHVDVVDDGGEGDDAEVMMVKLMMVKSTMVKLMMVKLMMVKLMTVKLMTVKLMTVKLMMVKLMTVIIKGLSFQVAREVFVQGMHNANHQKHRLREDVDVTVDELITIDVQGGKITEEGVRKNTSVALNYINVWLQVC